MTRQSRTSGRRLRGAECRARALELRKNGLTYEAIAQELGISLQYAHKTVSQALAALEKANAEEARHVRTLELERLETLFLKAFTRARKGDLGAIDRVLRIMERKAKLLGLDAPSRSEVTASLTSTNEWVELRTRILAVLERYPEARNELIRELQGEPI